MTGMIKQRHFNMRNLIRAIFIGVLGLGACAITGNTGVSAAESKTGVHPQKPLVVYFSHSGHTAKIAEDIHKKLGGDIIRIEEAKPYPSEYNALTEYAKKEKENNVRPAIKTQLPDLDGYGVIFLGYPNWWSTMPMPVFTFIEQTKMDGKTIAPFTTHGGGGIANSVSDLKKLCPNSRILKPFSIAGTKAASAEKDVEKWLEGLGTALIETTTGNTKIYPDGAY